MRKNIIKNDSFALFINTCYYHNEYKKDVFMNKNIKAKTVVGFYVLCQKLKNTIRSGWKAWNVKSKRLESVAEHVYGAQQLAIAMWSQYNYDVDIYKVIMMLALHELEEVVIGDLTVRDISYKDKTSKGHNAIKRILKDLIKCDEIENLILEFDGRETPEAKFAYYCDKLECDIQCKLYDESGAVDLTKQKTNPIIKDKYVQKLLGKKSSWSSMWLEYGRDKNNYDPNFTEISNYVEKHKIC